MGKVSPLEALSIVIGLLWAFGLFRLFLIPVVVRSEEKTVNQKNADSKPTKDILPSDKYGKDAELIDYEEVK